MDANLVQIFSFGLATFLLGFMVTPWYINMLKMANLGKQIRENATIGKAKEFFKLHSKKAGTPTMGGGVILGTVFTMVFLSLLLQKFGLVNNSLISREETYLTLFTLFTVGALGGIDDWMNIKGIGKTKGISARFKMIWLLLFSGLGAWWFYEKLGWSEATLAFPMFPGLELGILFIPLFMFVIIAAANSANISDGLDGLLGGMMLFAYGVYAYITYDQGMFLLSALCVCICGALVAFLWYNVKPAKFFMGDIASLALGANLGIMAMLTNTLEILIIVCMLLILNTLSVIIQLSSKKLRNGKKIFKIAPFHHHLEAIGWSEETIVFRMWLIGLILSVIGVIFYIISK